MKEHLSQKVNRELSYSEPLNTMSDPFTNCRSETERPDPSKIIKLVSSDQEVFIVREMVLKQSETLSYLMECGFWYYYPLPNVTAPILKMVIEYCNKHGVDAEDASKIETTEEGSSTMPASSTISDEELRNWDKQFVDVDQATLSDLIMAANFLHIDGLQDLAIQKMADINVKSPEEIRENLGIKTDFTPGDKEEVRERYTRWTWNNEEDY